MTDQTLQFSDSVLKPAVQNLMDVSAASLKGLEKMAHLQMKIARNTVQHGADCAKALSTAKGPQDLAKLQASWINFSMESLTSLSSAACGIGIETAKAWSKVSESQMSELGHRVHNAIEQFAKYAPAGSESGVALARSAWTVAGQAYETASKATRQAIAAAERNVESVEKTSLNLVKSA